MILLFLITFAAELIIEVLSSNFLMVKKVLLIGLTLIVGLVVTSCNGAGKKAPENGNANEVLKDTVISDSLQSEMALAIERQVVLERVKNIYGLIKQECTYLGGSVDNDWLDKSFCSKRWCNTDR